MLNASDVYCTFPTLRLASLILLRSAPFPSSAGSSMSARSSCRSELPRSVNSGSVNLIFLRKREREVSEHTLCGMEAGCLGVPSGGCFHMSVPQKHSVCGDRWADGWLVTASKWEVTQNLLLNLK